MVVLAPKKGKVKKLWRGECSSRADHAGPIEIVQLRRLATVFILPVLLSLFPSILDVLMKK